MHQFITEGRVIVLKQRKPKNLKELAQMAVEYLDAHNKQLLWYLIFRNDGKTRRQGQQVYGIKKPEEYHEIPCVQRRRPQKCRLLKQSINISKSTKLFS